MISSYRLGDLVLLTLTEDEKDELLNDYPDSIGSDFILKSKNKNIENKIELITNIFIEHLKKNKEYLPKDIKESTVVHLRLGDVIKGNKEHELEKRPYDIDYIKNKVPENDKIYIIGKIFFAKPSSNNYDECIEESNKYLDNVLNNLKATHFNSDNADIDLSCAVLAKTFVEGKGYFSKLIVEIRNYIKSNNIQLNIEDNNNNIYENYNTFYTNNSDNIKKLLYIILIISILIFLLIIIYKNNKKIRKYINKLIK